MLTKICIKCREKKKISEFYKHKLHPDDLSSWCKKCKKAYNKNWKKNNPEKVKEYNKKHNKKWYKNNSEKVKENVRNYQNNNSEKVKENHRKYYQEHKEYIIKKSDEWQKNNPEKRKIIVKKYHEKIRKTLKGKLDQCMGTAIHRALKGQKMGRKWQELVGWDENDLIKHMEKQFVGDKAWMNHDNYGNREGCWTVDHIIPINSFHYESENDIEFKKCWALSNLQPLEFITNCKKNDKILIHTFSLDSI